jgi:hypothetical protein
MSDYVSLLPEDIKIELAKRTTRELYRQVLEELERKTVELWCPVEHYINTPTTRLTPVIFFTHQDITWCYGFVQWTHRFNYQTRYNYVGLTKDLQT